VRVKRLLFSMTEDCRIDSHHLKFLSFGESRFRMLLPQRGSVIKMYDVIHDDIYDVCLVPDPTTTLQVGSALYLVLLCRHVRMAVDSQ
jgi:hypothetical protein